MKIDHSQNNLDKVSENHPACTIRGLRADGVDRGEQNANWYSTSTIRITSTK